MEIIIMDTSSNIQLAEVPTEGDVGVVWNRLHSEREDICESLLKESEPDLYVQSGEQKMITVGMRGAVAWHRELLQARLRKVDDALDRLMSGSYGECSKCGKWIEDTKLDFDPAIEFCLGCWDREQKNAQTAAWADKRRQTSEPKILTTNPLTDGDELNS
jgi:RNA polymerase-binding transcription factor DksA